MKRFILYLILGIFTISVLSCENVDPELYQNPPTIQDVRFQFDDINGDYVYFDVYITIDTPRYYEDIYGEINNGSKRFIHVRDQLYRCDYVIHIDDFDITTKDKGYIKLKNSLDISIISRDYDEKILSTFTVDEVTCILPSVESVQLSAISFTKDKVDFQIDVAFDTDLGYSPDLEIKTNSGSKRITLYEKNNVYSSNKLSFNYSEFDSIDYDEGIVKFDLLEIYYHKTFSNIIEMQNQSFLISKPSIQITKVKKDRTEYKSSEDRCYTYYDVYYAVTGTPFIKETYNYYIGNWNNNPGKGYSLSMNEGDHSNSSNVNYDYSFFGGVYIQYRAKTKAGTEIISDKTICLYGTGEGDIKVYLVDSSTISSTRSSNSNFSTSGVIVGSCIPIEREYNTQPMSVAIPILHQDE
uniref:hypothetical protein n=1 Tax=Alistipes sp. TaxID=1872444 RepID=UPI0040568C82